MIEYYYKNVKSEKLEKVLECKTGAWIRITEATGVDLDSLAQLLRLDSTDLVDCLDEFEIPRIEKLDNGVLIITKIPKTKREPNYTETFSIIVTEENVATIALSKDDFLNSLNNSKHDLNTTQKYKVVLSFLMKITSEFTLEIKKVRHRVLSNLALPRYSNLTERRIIDLTNDDEILSQYLAVLIPLKIVFVSIKNGNFFKVFEEDSDLLEDMILSVTQSIEIAGTNMKSIRSLRDSYQILFTNKLNKEIRVLTYLTIMLTIPTLIASFFGMNVPLPFQHQAQAPLIIVALSASLVGIVFYFLGRVIKK